MNFVRMLPVLYILLNVESRGPIGQDENLRTILFENRLIDTRAGLQLTVKLYNSAHVSPGDLAKAEERAAGIFRQAKIKINWDLVPPPAEVHDGGKSEAWNPADLHLRFWTRVSVGSNSYGEDTLGFRVSTETSTAIIIADEIRNRSATEFTNPGDLLGLVMAHEIGHLLLRSSAHSVEGIMQARLPTALRDRRRTLLVFSRQQATFIRAEIYRRTSVRSSESRDMAKIGSLVLNGGRWQGKQIVSEEWVKQSTKQQAPSHTFWFEWWPFTSGVLIPPQGAADPF